jgi:hypothetical protein
MSQLTVLLFLVALVVWLAFPGVRRRRREEVEPPDREELDQAEREVRDLDLGQDPEEGWAGDDWGPGAGRKP